MSFSKPSEPCKFCSAQTGIYTCPRCNAKYCSRACYSNRAHERCSEAFYQEWVISSLRETADPNDKAKMLEILKRVSQDDSDDDDGLSIDVRFAGLNLEELDEKNIWERLSKEEQEKFRDLLKNERELANIVPVLEPWWTSAEIKYIKDDLNSGVLTGRPPFPIVEQSVSSLMSKPPSDCIRYNVTNLLYAYVFLYRFYQGDLREFLEECVDSVFLICPVLSENKNYLSLEESVQDSIRLLTFAFKSVPVPVIKNLCADVCSIIKGPENASSHSYVLCAINDIKLLMLELLKIIKTCPDKSSKSNKKLLMLSVKKIDFLLCWVVEYFTKCLQPIVRDLQLMLLPEIIRDHEENMSSEHSGHQNKATVTSENLIVELN